MSDAGVTTPRFSIVLPTHNRADVLPFAIRSVLAQTDQDFELLVVGDGCTDGTAKVVVAIDDPRIRWFDLPKAPGFGYANRNVALRAARGDLIAFMAHDDLWLPDHLELLERPFANPAIEIVYSRPLWVAPDGLITPTAFNFYDRAMLDSFLARHENHIPASCIIHRRECFAKYGYWDEVLPGNGDWDMWARIIEGGGKRNFSYEPAPTCLHFRASWRTEVNAGPLELHVWRQLRARGVLSATFPAVPIEPGEPEQATTWRALSTDPLRWTRGLRASVQQALDQCVAQAELMIVAEDQHRRGAQLDQVLVLKDQQIANLEQFVASRDHAIGLLHQAIANKDQQIAYLERSDAEKKQRLGQLEDSCADETRQHAKMRATLAEREHRLAYLDHALADRDRRLQALEQALTEREQQIGEIGATLAQQQWQADQRRVEFEAAFADKERHINRIERRLPVRLYRLVRRLIH